jgi:GT2 family glycosyltransferase
MLLTVVVPTRDRATSLRLCLEGLSVQLAGADAEVLVVDDCSSDATGEVLEAHPEVRSIRLGSSLGSSGARNRAVAEASGEIVLFIDDDIVAAPGLVERHLQFHSEHPEVEQALVGLVTWHPGRPITAHMRWLERGGPLFAFDTIEDPSDVDSSHFCTANASVKRELLERVEGPFSERVRRFTDVEMAFRLQQAGMKLSYDSEAIGWHLRSDSPLSTDARMYEVGRAARQLEDLHPGLAPVPSDQSRKRARKAGMAQALTPLTPILPESIADRIWSARAAWAYSCGFHGTPR